MKTSRNFTKGQIYTVVGNTGITHYFRFTLMMNNNSYLFSTRSNENDIWENIELDSRFSSDLINNLI